METNPPVPPHRHLPRLDPSRYEGRAIVHWTMTIDHRRTGWLIDRFHAQFRELLVHAAFRERLLCPAYCLMPDHLHLVWMGIAADCDQLNGMRFLRRHLNLALSPFSLQKQAYDHVLRPEERQQDAFAKVCRYIFENPVRRGLVERAEEYPFSGAIAAGYPELKPMTADYWERFWRVHRYLIERMAMA